MGSGGAILWCQSIQSAHVTEECCERDGCQSPDPQMTQRHTVPSCLLLLWKLRVRKKISPKPFWQTVSDERGGPLPPLSWLITPDDDPPEQTQQLGNTSDTDGLANRKIFHLFRPRVRNLDPLLFCWLGSVFKHNRSGKKKGFFQANIFVQLVLLKSGGQHPNW